MTLQEAKKQVVLTEDGKVKVCGIVVGTWKKQNPRKERNDRRLVDVWYTAVTKETRMMAIPMAVIHNHGQYTKNELRESIAHCHHREIEGTTNKR